MRTRIELVEVSLPCFHVASTHKEVERSERVFAGNQQRLEKGKRLGIHESAWVTSNKRETSSASIVMCLNLPAERRIGKERGRQTYDTEWSMRRQTVYEETNGDVPVAQGFETTVLRFLSTHSLGPSIGSF